MTFSVLVLKVLLYVAIALVGVGLSALALVFARDVRRGNLW